MKRLQDFQFVSLSAEDGATGCRVVAMGGDEAVLATEGEGLPTAIVLPARALLGFDADGHTRVLSGAIFGGPLPGTLRFVITDNIGTREWRLRPRLTASLDAIVAPVSMTGDAVVLQRRLRTADISAEGAFVDGLAAAPDSEWDVAITVPGLTAPVRGRARVIRRTDQGAAVRFLDLDPRVAEDVERVILTVRLRIAQRASALAAERRAA